MSASKKITAHLGKNRIDFEVVPHRKVFTAYDLAQTLGAKLEDIAKTLLIQAEIPGVEKKGKHYFVVVLPASYNLDLPKLKKLLNAKKIDFSTERMMTALKIKPGALTPFGSLRKIGVVMDKSLLKTKHALMGAESFTESLRVKVKDFVRAEQPIVGVFGVKNTLKLQKRAVAKKKKPFKKRAKKRARAATTKVKRRKAARRPVPIRKKRARR